MFANDDVFPIFLAYIAHTEARLNLADAEFAADRAELTFLDFEFQVDGAVAAYRVVPSSDRRVFAQSLTNKCAGAHLDWLRAVAEVSRAAAVLRGATAELESVSKRLRDLV